MSKKKLLVVFMLIVSYLLLGSLAWHAGEESAAKKIADESTRLMVEGGRLNPCFEAMQKAAETEIAP